jgi:hypothetical protein
VYVVLFGEVVSVGREVLPIYVSDRYLYLAADTGDGYGRIYRHDLGSGDLEEVWSGEGARFSQIAVDYLRNRVVVVGLARDSGGLSRSAVFVFNPSSEGVDVVVHRNTGEINMFKSVIYDHIYRRFIVGERGYGVGVSSDGSNWPNGGGLWVIPYEDLMDYTRWVRVHEFGGNPEVTSIAIRTNNKVYVGLWRDGSVSRIVTSDITNLVSWDTEAAVRLNVKSHADSEGNTVILTFVDIHNVLKIGNRDPYTGDIPLGTVGGNVKYVSGKVVGKYLVMAIGKTSMTSDIYFNEIGRSSFSIVRADVDSVVDGKRFLYDGRKNLYIGSVAGLGSAKVYRLSFDYGRVLELDVSPSVVGAGDVVTLTAVLRDSNGMPISGARVDFYVANSVHSSPAGYLIGTRTTDGTGTASITYTVPASPERLMFFAIYRG